MYLGFPLMFSVLRISYCADLLVNVHDPWNPSNPHGISIILLFWGITAILFIGLNRYVLVNRMVPTDKISPAPWPLYVLSGDYELEPRPLYRNVPEGAEAPIDTLPGGDDDFIVQLGDPLPPTYTDDRGNKHAHSLGTVEAEIV